MESAAAALHRRLEAIAPSALAMRTLRGEDELDEAEAHAAAGCSRCARALVNARETGVELALASLSPLRGRGDPGPSAALRERVLAGARARQVSRAPLVPPRRFFDPSAELARLHLCAPGDLERMHEVDDLAADVAPPGDACGRFLAQLQRSIGFPLLFVSIVRGARVGYRVQRGLGDLGDPRDLAASMRDRRRETTFCTHTVSGDAPLVVPNAGEEPFFRGSHMVTRSGVRAYVGVPLRTSRGVALGTLCAMDFRPRAIGADVVRALELFTEPVLAEIESPRRAPAAWFPRTAAGTPIHDAAWFQALLDVDLALSCARAGVAGRSSTLLVARGDGAELLADLGREDEAAGRLGDDAVGLLLSGTDAAGAESRSVELADALARVGGPLHLVRVPSAAHRSAASWCDDALGPRA